ncbi:MAG TPA: glycosyltransferase family 1 protein [Acidobacteriaceae bacterium]|jgi:glycosyltransferase involved in cell wall biosynthesis
MKVLLVGNYAFDATTSMKIFADTMYRELSRDGIDVRVLTPKALLGKLKPSATGLGKWLGYVDKFLLFPFTLRRAAAKADVVHICDHSNAMYSFAAGSTPVLATCHDLIAVRGALGEVPDCPASFFGKTLQRWVLRGLKRATRVACVSDYTYQDALRLLGKDARLVTVLNGLVYPFQRLSEDEVERRLTAAPALERPFVMHIGSNLMRKNREAVLRVFAQVARQADAQLVIAGQPLSTELKRQAERLGILERIVEIAHPGVELVEALYNKAAVLFFPSRYEGFGWPPIEAQACGCPVVASDIPTSVEVLGDSAKLFPLDDEAGMAGAVTAYVEDSSARAAARLKGLENVQARFQPSRMIEQYETLYRELVCPS